nr:MULTISPECIES: hypothetical protein [Microbacterium]
MRKASDRVPTKWFAAIGTGLFLAVTAAFGGLNAVAEEVVEPPRLVAGDTHTSPQFAVTVERVVLIDDLSEAGVSAEEGTRALVVIATATNTWDQPQGTNGTDSLAELITIDGLDVAAPSGIARMDDQTYGPRLQPGVPAQLAIAWRVDAGAYHEGDEITVVLTDQTMFTGSTVLAGRYWDDPVVGATVTVVATDVGAGVDS